MILRREEHMSLGARRQKDQQMANQLAAMKDGKPIHPLYARKTAACPNHCGAFPRIGGGGLLNHLTVCRGGR